MNSLSHNYIKQYSKSNSSFTKEIEEKKLNIRFDDFKEEYHLHNENSNNLSKYKMQNESLSNDILNNNDDISEQVFNIFNKFPLIIKYNSNFLMDLYKLFMFSKDFFVSCGEKYIIKSLLILFNITFPEYYNNIFTDINKEFKQKYNEGKDFFLDKIESILINENNEQLDKKIDNNIKAELKRRSTTTGSILNNTISQRNTLDNNDSKKYTYNQFHSRSVVITKEKLGIEGIARKGSIDDDSNEKITNDNNIDCFIIKNDKDKDKTEEYEQSVSSTLLLLRKLIIDYLDKSKNGLKIYNIIRQIIGKNVDRNNIFLLLCKWKIINKDNINRNEDINIFKSWRKLKNYFDGNMNNISIENYYPNKTISIKTPISNTNYIINNDYKKIPYRNMNKIIMKSLIPEAQYLEVESILNKKLLHERQKKINASNKGKFIKKDSNSFCFVNSPNIALNEIKESENEDKDNYTGSDNEKNNDEKEKNILEMVK